MSTDAEPARAGIKRGGARGAEKPSMRDAVREESRAAFREAAPKLGVQLLEPIMKVALEGPSEHSGNMLSTLMARRGMIIGTTEADGMSTVEAEVPLAPPEANSCATLFCPKICSARTLLAFKMVGAAVLPRVV